MKGGFVRVIARERVELRLSWSFFGISGSKNIDMCLPINLDCFKEILEWFWDQVKSGFECCQVDSTGIFRRNLADKGIDISRSNIIL